MIAMLWTQHRDRWTVGGRTVRRITYWDFKRLTAGIDPAQSAHIGRINAKRQAGGELTEEELADLDAYIKAYPLDAMYGSCFIPPLDGPAAREVLDTMPRRESEELEAVLASCITPEVPEDEAKDPLAVAMVATGGLGVDIADLTVGQGMAVAAMLQGAR